MSSLLVVGAGGFATEVDELARLCGYDDVVFLDDNPSAARCTPVIGRLEDIMLTSRIINPQTERRCHFQQKSP